MQNTKIIYRVRAIDIDGGKIGKTWFAKFFETILSAEKWRIEYINQQKAKNSKYEYKQDTIEGVNGIACWQFGIMYTLDGVIVE